MEATRDYIRTLGEIGDDPDKIIKILWGIGVNSTNRLSAMINLTAFSSPETFWRVFNQCWSDCDDTWDLQEDLLNTLECFHYEDSSPQGFLSPEAKEFFSKLPDRITVYRGCDRSRIRAISWTTDPKIAKSFAKGHRGIRLPDPVVMTAKVWKRDVITIIQDREESEVIIDPRSLRYLQELKMLEPQFAE